jgi:glutamate dehydrogenase
MTSRAEERKREAIAKIVALATERGPLTQRFLRQFYAHVAPADILARTPEALVAAALSLWDFAQWRVRGEVKLRIIDGGRAAPTIVEIVNDDMPFLLDSLAAALAGEGLTPKLVIHPILAVEREDDGRLVNHFEIGAAPANTHPESMMRLELAAVTDADRRARLEASLRAVLAEIRAAYEDWPRMRAALKSTQAALKSRPPRIEARAIADAQAFLAWLDDEHFVFLGSREYRFASNAGAGAGDNDIVPGTGLGILRDDARSVFEGLRRFSGLPAYIREFLLAPRIVEITRSSARSLVLRAAPMDAIAVKLFDAIGKPVGVKLFVGLFTWLAHRVSPRGIPLLAAKVEQVLRRSGVDPLSHDGQALIHIIESLPRDEMFQIDEDGLLDLALGIRDLEERPRIGLFIRRDPFGRFLSCFVFVPRENYAAALPQRFGAILGEALDAAAESVHVELDDAVLARLLFVLRTDPERPAEFDVEAVERRLAEAGRNWADAFQDALLAAKSEEVVPALLRRYRDAFPASYRERFSAADAVADLGSIEELAAGAPFALGFESRAPESSSALSFKLFRPREPIPLSDILPLLEQMGLRVLAEYPFEIAAPEGIVSYQEFVVAAPAPTVAIARDRARFLDAVGMVLRGEAESDGLNRLVLGAGLDWRDVAILRLYARFLRQTGTSFSLAYMEQTLARHGGIAAKLAAAFKRRFDPGIADGAAETERIAAEIAGDLDAVTSLDDDRILRHFLLLIRHSLRTNFFQHSDGRPRPHLAVKFASAEIELLPLPRPRVEIFVTSPAMEGVHMRAGAIARGGIRWSDRREDFRTEILGLMKAQVVKNAVIVPTGSKGGFIVKHPPRDPPALHDEAVRCYRTLLDGMLDLTDNFVAGKIVRPADTVRYDGDDPYLVVAADKGTASFSDIANALAVARDFWLGDAFASGGSEGYDHKAMGVTARGAWELVKRHFRERGTDIQTTDFSVIGVGDMSGDVFGNGMLQSPHIRLLAAFDHRHVFLDPVPDAAKSFAERKRLFKLPHSSWADYDAKRISPGGGVFARDAKAIALSPQVRTLLGISEASLDPAALIRVLLKAPVDLLWFGGIGTYVKASDERDADVGDRGNDALRVDGCDLRAAVVGEGANLGVTQKGRIEYALKGGRIDTDAIDNSAGVDTSDREVNIKIALDALVRTGALKPRSRNALIHALTDEVAGLVLADNYAQGLALSLAQAAQPQRFDADRRLLRDLERVGHLDRAVEFLPSDEILDQRGKAGVFFTRPELAVLLAYAKNTLTDALIASDLPDDPQLENDLFAYFPAALAERHRPAIVGHRLRREIIATVAANDIVNRGGIAFVDELADETGRGPGDVARAFMIARGVFDLDALWDAVCALDNRVRAAIQIEMLSAGRQIARIATAWFLRHVRTLDIEAERTSYRDGIAALADAIGDLLGDTDRAALMKRANEFRGQGVPDGLARRTASLAFLEPALLIVQQARSAKGEPVALASAFYRIGERLGIEQTIRATQALEGNGPWDRRAARMLRHDIYARVADFAERAAHDEAGFEAFLAAHGPAWSRFKALAEEPAPDLARLLLANQALQAIAAS